MTTHYEKFQAVRLHSGVSHTDGAVCTGAGSPPPSFVPSVHDPAIAQPVILSPADSLPSSLTRTAVGSPTSLYLNIGAEDDYHFPEKRKRDEADDFNASKFARTLLGATMMVVAIEVNLISQPDRYRLAFFLDELIP